MARIRKHKRSAMDRLLYPTEEDRKEDLRAGKEYFALRTQETTSPWFSHPEYMEEAELRAEQIKEIRNTKRQNNAGNN